MGNGKYSILKVSYRTGNVNGNVAKEKLAGDLEFAGINNLSALISKMINVNAAIIISQC